MYFISSNIFQKEDWQFASLEEEVLLKWGYELNGKNLLSGE